MTTTRFCCCGSEVCDSDTFSCSELTGRAKWNFDYRYNYTRSLSAVWSDCYELAFDYANCNDPGAQGPRAWAEQSGSWDGTFRMYVSSDVEDIVNMPQSITVSDPPTNDELCDLASWDEAASPGTCTPVTPTVLVSSTLEYEGKQQYGWNTTTSTWGTENNAYEATVEVRLVSQPPLSWEAKLRKRLPAYWRCENNPTICDTTTCYFDALYTIDTTNRLEFRVEMTSYEYAPSDLTQTGTPTQSYNFTSTWKAVNVPLVERRIYEGMTSCDSPNPPVVIHPMRGFDEDEAVSGWTNDVRRAIELAIGEAWNDVQLGLSPPGLFMQSGYEPTKTGANQHDLLFRRDTTAWWPNTQDDQGMGNLDTDTGDFEPLTFCQMFLHYQNEAPTATHERTSEATIAYNLTACSPCGVTNSGTGTQDFDYGFVSVVNLTSLAAEDCT